ncbi:NAD-dependent epimerase/dehydratase family protein [archaeon]|nr:NAD-dependent epimerase/dehydratase family protein [archaeon]
MVKNILITGGLGFIGSNLAHESVARGYNVTLFTKTLDKIKNIRGIEDNVLVVEGDIVDIPADIIMRQDYIFHCASTSDNYNIHSDPRLDIKVNCMGTISLLEACREHNPSARIVYPSTFFVNGNLDELPATPKSPCDPLGLYPATRLAGEQFCKIYNKVFNMNNVIARFTNVFGVREQCQNKKKAAFNYMINLAIDNQEIPLYNSGEFVRDYIYVSDVVDACLVLAESGESGETYYVGRGEQTKFKDLMDIVVEEAGGGKLEPISPPEFHKNVGITDYWCDNTPLKSLGWSPRVSLREGVRKTIEYYGDEKNE